MSSIRRSSSHKIVPDAFAGMLAIPAANLNNWTPTVSQSSRTTSCEKKDAEYLSCLHRKNLSPNRRGKIDSVMEIPFVRIDSRRNDVFILSGVLLLLSGQM